ncbi:MAG TPA: helix-turn-helix domain-containing protein [Sedimentibacter sp.]|nr:helix-turn-helix domain-containing protein [Sedimentibacter sp.]
MAGRPSKYKTEYAEQAYKLCLLGATDKDMANFFDTTEQTINAWKQKYPEFLESLKRGKMEADSIVAQKLYHRAIGYEHPEIITASYQGMITDAKEVIKHYAPDPTAAIFWLKNRQPKQWRDKQEVESVNTNINTDISDLPPEALEEIAKAQGQEEVMRIVSKYRK